nr:MAG TPA: Portal protein [Caudoviricetes sp.]
MAEEKSGTNAKLQMWKERFAKANAAYQKELANIETRDAAWRGDVEPIKYTSNEKEAVKTPHVRNIIAEIIESEVDTGIPMPKVTAKRKEDERLAKIIEDMLRDELDRMSFEIINDWAERVVPIHGGCFYLIEWDGTQRGHSTVGENKVTRLNPKQVIPQEGIYEIEELEYLFVLLPQTKEYIKKRYGVTFDKQDSEEQPDIRTADGDSGSSDDLVTQYIAYYRGADRRIGMYSWVLDTELVDDESYQERHTAEYQTEKYGIQPPDEVLMGEQSLTAGTDGPQSGFPDGGDMMPWTPGGEMGIPEYTPDVFPVVMQRNVTSFGSFLGNSDVDLILDQQRTTNRIEARIIEKLLTGGSYTILPSDANIKTNNDIGKTITADNPAKAAGIRSVSLTEDITQELSYLSQIYEEARQAIGITDSYQGRKDATATSKVAKEFAAKQTAGRLESKKQMKNFAYSKIFEILFKYKLAYADEPRPIRATDKNGDAIYEEFNRMDFLRRDEAGELYWNDDFTFSCDTSAPLASNREAMWQETRMNLESGAFGDPTSLETLILFWGKMETLHYPGASETKQYLMDEKERQDQLAAEQQRLMNGNIQAQIEEAARQAAMRDAGMTDVQATGNANYPSGGTL